MKPVNASDILEADPGQLFPSPLYSFGLSRRRFVQALGGGMAILFTFPQVLAQRRRRPPLPQEIGAWLHIAEDGAVTVYTGKVEVGQNIRTSLAQIVAEELRLPVESIAMVMGDTDRTPYDRGTFGSQSTPQMGTQLRKVGAAARQLLIEMAAEKWQVDQASLRLAEGKVTHPQSGRSLSLGQLTQGQKLVKTVGEDAPVTPAQDWKVAGQSAAKVNGRSFVVGQHQFVSDIKLPGMLIGKVLRPPAFGVRLVSLDASQAQAMPGVTVVRDGNFAALAAPDAKTAARAVEAMEAQWESAPGQPSRSEIFDYLKNNLAEVRGFRGRSRHVVGSMEEGLKAAHQTLKRSYTIDYIAHVPMEPRAALAQWEGEKLTVWTGTQRPFGVRSELARAFQMPEEKVRVIMPDTGSAYGGKHSGEAALEAARLARAAGQPVKLVWTRQEEFTWAYFRPAGVIEVQSGMDREGRLTAWEHHNYNSGRSAIRTPYEAAHQHIEFHPCRSPLRTGSYRALASTANIFAREVQMDEMARMLKMDPLQFRLKNLKDERLAAVFQAAAQAFGWGKGKPAPQCGFGMGGGLEKGSYVAAFVEVSVQDGEVRVKRVVQAFECGAIINPDHLKSQVEGCIVQGLGGALFERVDFEKGKILNPLLSSYRVPRFSDLPAIEVVLLNRKDLPSAGAGETPIAAVAPAISNAIFDATGIRRRSLPLAPNGLEA
ncbi:MAG: molybdopterin cofactor-binding domain-containing protein [Acidobacteriota bacterium]